MTAASQTVAGAYQMIAAHEQLCAERYRGINEKLTWVLGCLATMVLALLAWALVQLYALEPLRASMKPTEAEFKEQPRFEAADCRVRGGALMRVETARRLA